MLDIKSEIQKFINDNKATLVKGAFTIIILIILIVSALFISKSSSFVLVKTNGDKKIKIEVYETILGDDDCLDSLTTEDSLAIISTLSEVNYKAKPIKYIALHTTASKEGVFPSQNWWESFFYKEKYPGMNMVGYNYLVSDTKVFELRPVDKNKFIDQDELVWGVAGFNSQTISIAYVGGCDKNLKPKDTRTPRQKFLMDSLIYEMKKIAPTALVQGHRQFPKVKKSCPNFEVINPYKFPYLKK